MIMINIKPLRNKQTPRKIPLYKKADWEGLKKHISEFGRSLQSNLNISTPVNQLWHNITSELERAINKFITHKTAKIKDRQPWINTKIRRLMRKRDKLYYKNSLPPEKSRKLKTLKHLIQSQSIKAYWDYVEDLITPKDEHSPGEKFSISKKFYTFIKQKKTDSTGIKTLKKNGSTVTDSEQKADLLNNHFFSVFSQQIPMKLSALCKYFTNLSQSQENDMPEIQVTERGVLKLLQALNISKAAGPDGIRPRVLKELSSELATIFTLLFQASIHQQSLPDI